MQSIFRIKKYKNLSLKVQFSFQFLRWKYEVIILITNDWDFS